MAAYVGSFMYSAAAMVPPTDFVYESSFRASFGVQTPRASRVPGLVAKEVTSLASAAFEKSTTPFHCARVKTPPKPGGGFAGAAASESWKYVVFAHVPLTRT